MENETSTKVKPIIEKGFGQGFQEKIGDVLFQNNKTNIELLFTESKKWPEKIR